MLLLKVSHLEYRVHSAQVHYVDYIDSITLLPFAVSPVEGIAQFNSRPLLQINLAQALALPKQNGEKRVIFETGSGQIALRVDQVLNFTSNKSKPAPPLLIIHDILPWIIPSTLSVEPIRCHSKSKSPQSSLTVLLITTADKTVALLSAMIFCIEEIDALQPLDYQDSEADLLLKVKNNLLPGYSLARFLDHPPQPTLKQKAVIIRTEQNPWALVVDQVLGLETVESAYSIAQNNTDLWYITQAGEIREIIDPNRLIGAQSQFPPIKSASQWDLSSVQMLNQISTEGLRIYCGKNSYMLPLTLASSTLDLVENSLLTRHRYQQKNLANAADCVPWIDLTKLLSENQHHKTNLGVLISLPNQGQLVLGVEKALLQLPLTSQQWLPLTNLPPTCALFFDAASYDPEIGQWILRVTEKIEFANLPWCYKKKIVKAIAGWFDLTTVLSLNVST